MSLQLLNNLSNKNDSTHLISGKWGDSTAYYTINTKGTEKFLKVLKGQLRNEPGQ